MPAFDHFLESDSQLQRGARNVLAMKMPRFSEMKYTEEDAKPALKKVRDAYNLDHLAVVVMDVGPKLDLEDLNHIKTAWKYHAIWSDPANFEDSSLQSAAERFNMNRARISSRPEYEFLGMTTKSYDEIKDIGAEFMHQHTTYDEQTTNCVTYVDYLRSKIIDESVSGLSI